MTENTQPESSTRVLDLQFPAREDEGIHATYQIEDHVVHRKYFSDSVAVSNNETFIAFVYIYDI